MHNMNGASPAPHTGSNSELTAIVNDATLNALTGAEQDTAEAVLAVIQATLEDDKADDLVIIPLAGKTDIADYMVIASGRSTTHVKAMADHVQQKLKQSDNPPLSSAGAAQGDWVAIDAIDVLVHIFRPEVRDFYQIEKMWQADFADQTSADVQMVSVS